MMGRGAFRGTWLSPPCTAQPSLKQPRVSATYLFLNTERWGAVTGGPKGEAPKDST